MRKVLIFFCAIFLISFTVVFAETLTNENAVINFTTKVMIKVAADNLDAALQIIKPHSSFTSEELDNIAVQTKLSKEQSRKRYGAPTGYEFIDLKKSGSNLLRLRYIEKTEKQVFLWTFYFYKIKKNWILNAFYWDGDYKPLFNE